MKLILPVICLLISSSAIAARNLICTATVNGIELPLNLDLDSQRDSGTEVTMKINGVDGKLWFFVTSYDKVDSGSFTPAVGVYMYFYKKLPTGGFDSSSSEIGFQADLAVVDSGAEQNPRYFGRVIHMGGPDVVCVLDQDLKNF